MARTDVIASAPAVGLVPSLARSRERVVASWAVLAAADDDAGAADRAPSIGSFEIAAFDPRGVLVSRETIEAPPELRARKGGVEDAGVVVEDDGARLVHWTETTASTDPDGRVRNAAALKAAYVGGSAAPVVLSPPRGACERCALRVAFASLGSESVAIVRTEPDVRAAPLAEPAPPPAFAALRFRRDGAVTAEELPWLSVPRIVPGADGGLAALPTGDERLSASVDASDAIALVTGPYAWAMDRALRPIRGPVALPAPDARIAWADDGSASVAWASSPGPDDRTRPEVFLGLAPPGASAVTSLERVTRGRAVLALDRRGDEVGIVLAAGERAFFAAAAPRGAKRGGDVLLRPGGDVPFDLQASEVLVVSGPGRFTDVALGPRALVVSEVVCAP